MRSAQAKSPLPQEIALLKLNTLRESYGFSCRLSLRHASEYDWRALESVFGTEEVDTLRQQVCPDVTLVPGRSPTHRCRDCGALWIELRDGWSLCSRECGPCCDNSGDFLSRLDALWISDCYVRLPDERRAVSADREKRVLVACDCDASSQCPQGRAGSQQKCFVWVSKP